MVRNAHCLIKGVPLFCPALGLPAWWECVVDCAFFCSAELVECRGKGRNFVRFNDNYAIMHTLFGTSDGNCEAAFREMCIVGVSVTIPFGDVERRVIAFSDQCDSGDQGKRNKFVALGNEVKIARPKRTDVRLSC